MSILCAADLNTSDLGSLSTHVVSIIEAKNPGDAHEFINKQSSLSLQEEASQAQLNDLLEAGDLASIAEFIQAQSAVCELSSLAKMEGLTGALALLNAQSDLSPQDRLLREVLTKLNTAAFAKDDSHQGDIWCFLILASKSRYSPQEKMLKFAWPRLLPLLPDFMRKANVEGLRKVLSMAPTRIAASEANKLLLDTWEGKYVFNSSFEYLLSVASADGQKEAFKYAAIHNRVDVFLKTLHAVNEKSNGYFNHINNALFALNCSEGGDHSTGLTSENKALLLSEIMKMPAYSEYKKSKDSSESIMICRIIMNNIFFGFYDTAHTLCQDLTQEEKELYQREFTQWETYFESNPDEIAEFEKFKENYVNFKSNYDGVADVFEAIDSIVLNKIK